jgi:glycine/sarcosine/betaine reductase complex component A
MDLEEQGTIQRLVESGERDRMLVVLGTPNASSTRMIALTLTQGDPSFAGPLAGVPLGLRVYHILEDEVKAAIAPGVYAEEIGPLEFLLDKPGIVEALRQTRAGSGV